MSVILTLANGDRIELRDGTPGVPELIRLWHEAADGSAEIVGGLRSERHGQLDSLSVRYRDIVYVTSTGGAR